VVIKIKGDLAKLVSNRFRFRSLVGKIRFYRLTGVSNNRDPFFGFFNHFEMI